MYDHLLSCKKEVPLLALFAAKEESPVEPLLASNAMFSERLGHSGDKFPLAVAQRDALSHYITQQPGDILAVNGPPGTGKTTLVLSIIATEWARAALNKTEPPVVIATSTNNQAVTNIIEAFGKDFATGTGPMAGRWLPEVKSFGAYFPSSGRRAEAVKKYQTEDFFNRVESLEYVEDARCFFLEKARAAFPHEGTGMGNRMWMIRGDGGKLYDDFRDKQIVGIGWSQLAPLVKPGLSRAQLLALYQEADPLTKLGTARSGASQVWRFVNEIQKGDWVITYSPANRTYLLGKVTSDFQYHPEWVEEGMGIARQVKWNTQEIDRDRLSVATKNSLGSTLTVFQLPEYALAELLQDKKPTIDVITQNPVAMDEDEVVSDPLRDMEMLAFEGIKDRINSLDWDEMQNLVAGVLRSMGYKTQVSPAGADRGKDIIASPDGFGFENPRIIVEVKHRREQMGSQQIRSFIGGRHKDDRGLYVSTGGFTKDARYEADRSTIPLTLWTLDDLVRALIENYEQVDIETKLLVPLKKTFLPA